MTGVLCVGLATLDVIQRVEQLPESNEKVVALDSVTAAGGPAANAAVAAAHLGSPARLVTALAEHAIAGLIRADLEACGVGVEAVPTDSAPIVASILVTAGTGERAIVSPTSSASAAPEPGASAADALAALDDTRVVLTDGYYPWLALPLASAARERGIPVIADLGSFKPHSPDVLRACDAAVVSGDFAPPGIAPGSEDVLEYLVDHGVAVAAVTRGDQPVLLRVGESTQQVPPAPVQDVADTCGAGDFFHGALAHRVAALGWDPGRAREDLAFAAVVAGWSIASFGTRAWLRV